jgi:hypothetical protein
VPKPDYKSIHIKKRIKQETHNFWTENPARRDHFEDLYVDRRIRIRWILKSHNV